MTTHSKPSTIPLTEDPAREVCLRISAQSGALAEDLEFTEFIERGTARLTPRILAQMVSEMPDIREKLPELVAAGLPQTHAQLAFLADVVERSVLQDPLYCDLPCSAALEAAFALQPRGWPRCPNISLRARKKLRAGATASRDLVSKARISHENPLTKPFLLPT